MNIDKLMDGDYAEARLESGERIIFRTFPNRIAASKKVLIFFTAPFWEFTFPFCIRSSREIWDSAREVLKTTVECAASARDFAALRDALNRDAAAALQLCAERHAVQPGAASDKKANLEEVQQIVRDFSKVLEQIGQDMLSKYPAAVYPESLLPHPREKILRAFDTCIRYAGDAKTRENMKGCLVLLDNFIDDEEAAEKNAKVLKTLNQDAAEKN